MKKPRYDNDQEHNVPSSKLFRPSTRDNSNYKWQTETVVGALELSCDPFLDLHQKYKPINTVASREDAFEAALQVWHDLDLRRSFQRCAESVPVETVCCGIRDNLKTLEAVRDFVNERWTKDTNVRLKPYNVSVDCFIFSWNNLSTSTTDILLIRFHKGKRRWSGVVTSGSYMA